MRQDDGGRLGPDHRRLAHRFAPTVVATVGLAIGCVSESSIRMAPDDRRPVRLNFAETQKGMHARAWLGSAHAQLADLLPAASPPALLTGDLAADGQAVDVPACFGFNAASAHTILGNPNGLRCTAQGANQTQYVDEPPPPWDGFEDVWIEVSPDVALAARFGMAPAEHGPARADAIVILPGFLGDNGVTRTSDLAAFLRDAGFHVLAVELRGHGQTERRFPEVAYTFGVRECDDLMLLADWLQAKPFVRRTGLVGYCWGANTALLAAWFENRSLRDPNITASIDREMVTSPAQRRYEAGIMAFSPILRWEDLLDELEHDYGFLKHPAYHTLQKTIRGRMQRKAFEPASGSLRGLIEAEYRFGGVALPRGPEEGYQFLRLLPHAEQPCPPKLDRVRVPTLIVHAVDDPLAPSQTVADLIDREDNPHVAAVVLPGGGHVGFAAYSKQYYYSLIAAFFDPVSGAAAALSNAVASRPQTPVRLARHDFYERATAACSHRSTGR